MSLSTHPLPPWLRRVLPVSESRRSWQAAVPVGFLALGVAAIWFSAERITVAQQAALWVGLVVALAVFLRKGWLTLLGPLFGHELVRTTRRSRYTLMRVYIYFVCLILGGVFLNWYAGDRKLQLPAHELARLGDVLFFVFSGFQFLFVLLVVPGYAAGCVTEEKEHRSFEALLTTDLSSREIILGKVMVRLANLTLMLLTGLPIIGFMQFLGGIEPDLVLVFFLVTVLTMGTLVCLSVLNSVYARRSRDAILYTYLELITFLVLGFAASLLPAPPAGVPEPFYTAWLWFGHFLDFLNTASPFTAFRRIVMGVATGQPLADILQTVLRDYITIHLLICTVFITWAILRLRGVFLRQAYGETREARRTRWFRWRPEVGNRPMFWKEVRAESGLHLHWFSRLLLLILVLATLGPRLYMESYRGAMAQPAWMESVGIWMRISSTCVACLLLIGVAIRAANTISGERDRVSWESLLSTPFEALAILGGKWLGSILSVRWGWAWIGLIWLIAWPEVQLHPLGIPLFVFAWLVYASLVALVGLWFSLVCATSLRALVCTLFALGTLMVGFLILPLYSHPAIRPATLSEPFFEWLSRFQMGLAPPMVLGRMLPFLALDKTRHANLLTDRGWEIPFALLGLTVWIVVLLIWGAATFYHFNRSTNRWPVRGAVPPLEA